LRRNAFFEPAEKIRLTLRDAIVLGAFMPREDLYALIDARIDSMLAQGFVKKYGRSWTQENPSS
jgi:tRNA A37 N6-isopentenylltransferase MiaA